MTNLDDEFNTLVVTPENADTTGLSVTSNYPDNISITQSAGLAFRIRAYEFLESTTVTVTATLGELTATFTINVTV